MSEAEYRLRLDLQDAEAKAWDALSRYKFMMFGYWAAVWVHLNRIGGFKEANPWKQIVRDAKNSTRLAPPAPAEEKE